MKKNIINSSILLISVFLYTGCNSAIYEIVEVEEPVEIKEEMKQPVADIKEDMTTKQEEKKEELKYTTEQVVSKTFIVQIGAFKSETAAEKLTRSASEIIQGQSVYYKDVEGLYKVRVGSFDNKQDALEFLAKVRALNYSDSFVVQLTNVMVK
jgi:cell division protein FtsN